MKKTLVVAVVAFAVGCGGTEAGGPASTAALVGTWAGSLTTQSGAQAQAVVLQVQAQGTGSLLWGADAVSLSWTDLGTEPPRATLSTEIGGCPMSGVLGPDDSGRASVVLTSPGCQPGLEGLLARVSP